MKKIEQSPIIAAQIAKAIQGYEGAAPINITLNMNATQIGSDAEQVGDPKSLDLLALIETFPQPRMRNFINYIYYEAMRKFSGNKTASARWLGTTTRTLLRISSPVKLLTERGEEDYEEDVIDVGGGNGVSK